MDHNTQTIKFVVAAGVMIGLAALTNIMTKPSPVEGFGKVGEPFFEDFEDPYKANALRVVAYTEDTASARVFLVEKKDGVWRIPSHHDYPADGEEQLAKTARTLIGVSRGALASRVAADQERFGVVDPLDEDTDALKGRGQRITLFKEGEIPIADLIIGKKLPDSQNRYYVRHPEEKDTYIAELEVDISTKFRDWVEADLLRLDRDNLRRLQSQSTKVSGPEISEAVEATLTREGVSDPWQLKELEDENREVDEDKVSEMVNVIDNLKLSGVRPKPKFGGQSVLQGDLSIALPKGAADNPQIVNQVVDVVQNSLQSKGFFVYENRGEKEFRLYSRAGELIAATEDGVRYHMSFGNEFEGSEKEIEIGGEVAEAAPEGDESASEAEDKAAGPAEAGAAEADASDDETEEQDTTKSRYLIVRASFDESLLGPKPVEPVKPDVPEGVKVDDEGNVLESVDAAGDEAEAAEAAKAGTDAADAGESESNSDASDSEEAGSGDAKAGEAKADDAKADAAEADNGEADEAKADDAEADAAEANAAEADAESSADDKSEDDQSESEKSAGNDAEAEGEKSETDGQGTEDQDGEAKEGASVADVYQRAIEKYRADRKKYESDLKEYEKQVADAQEQVDQLNERFADWYYVILEEDFAKLHLSREDLVKEKEEEEEGGEGAAAGGPAPGGAAGQVPGSPILTPPTSTPEKKSKPESGENAPAASKKPSSTPDESTDADTSGDADKAEGKAEPEKESAEKSGSDD